MMVVDVETTGLDCKFCRIYQKGDEVFHQNELFFAVFDRFPVNPGHAEIILKRHAVSLRDLIDEEQNLVLPTIFDVIEVIEQTDLKKLYQSFIKHPLNDKSAEFSKRMLKHVGIDRKPDGHNYGINDGKAAGRTIDHLHIHIIPRYFGDVEDPIGGVRHIIPGMGNYKK